MSAATVAAEVNAGRLGAEEVVRECLAAIEEHSDLNATITVCAEAALSRARERRRGPLAGVPFLPKDMFDTAGIRTTYGSRIYAEHVPDATASAVAALEEAGAVPLGKANQHEFAWGTTSQNPHYGFVRNPVRPGHVAGGSSGGNAAALATGMCALGLGTDTGGSVRIPSACCDTVGFKTALGKVPDAGCFRLSESFDTIGPMARTVRDCALAYSVLSGDPVPPPRLEGLVVGVLAPTPHAARLEALGARVVEARLPEPRSDIGPLFMFECAVAHRDTFPSRREEYGEDTRAKWDLARAVRAIDVYEARLALPEWRDRALTEPAVDLVVSPTLGMEVPPIDCWELDVRIPMTVHTRPFNFLDWPAVSVADLQIAGRSHATVLGAALAWEEAYGPPPASVPS
jgi:aspartyl-tRNA(Asn)/glutamyl-tRNA(Gln) amidotransferase subunit A